MDKTNVLATAVVLLLAVLPICASGEATIPYIEIRYPGDGETVGETTTLAVAAEGYGLKEPYVTIKGEQLGVSFPLQGCVYESPVYSQVKENGSEDTPSPPPVMKMYCKTEIDLSSFRNQKITLAAGVWESGRQITDSVGLYVSGQCA